MTAELEVVLKVPAVLTYLKASLANSARRDSGKIAKAYDRLAGHETEIRMGHLLIGHDMQWYFYCFDPGIHLLEMFA
jgi:hypothetical protein